MLDGLLPGEFDEWLAYREIEPDPLDRLFTILRLGFSAVCNAWGAKVEPQHIDPYMERQTGTAAVQQEASPNQAVAMVSMVLGAPN